MTHTTDDWQVTYDPKTGLIDIRAIQANVLDLYNMMSRLANNYVVVKARPAPLDTPMTEQVCTA